MRGRKTGGRQAGMPDRITRDLKDAVLRAFDDVGGASYLATADHENPAAFCALLGKALPRELAGSLTLGLGDRIEAALRRESASEAAIAL